MGVFEMEMEIEPTVRFEGKVYAKITYATLVELENIQYPVHYFSFFLHAKDGMSTLPCFKEGDWIEYFGRVDSEKISMYTDTSSEVELLKKLPEIEKIIADDINGKVKNEKDGPCRYSIFLPKSNPSPKDLANIIRKLQKYFKVSFDFLCDVPKEEFDTFYSKFTKQYPDFININGIEIQGRSDERARWNEGLEKLLKQNYERYPRSHELFDILLSVLKGNTSPKMKAVYKDIKRHGTFLDHAWLRSDDDLIVYTGISGLNWHEYNDKNKCCRWTYLTNDFKFEEKKVFSIKNVLNSNCQLHNIKDNCERRYLKDFDDDFVKYFSGRKMKELPNVLKEGSDAIRLDLPDNTIVPVSFNWFWFLGHACYDTVRGARKAKTQDQPL